uniref:Uncharacterized protein n=1 Tax=Rhizophora mucronata TaxID=61149 RepID=A0A2P2PF21_RHIMU
MPIACGSIVFAVPTPLLLVVEAISMNCG